MRTNAENIAQWAASNLERPGERVPVRRADESASFVRELVRRGLDAGALDSFRTAQNAAWQLCIRTCFDLTDDPALLRELLETMSTSIATYLDDTVAYLAEQISVARAELAGDNHAQRRAAVSLLLDGAPIPQDRAETQLRYSLSGPHIAAVLTGGSDVAIDELEAVSALLVEHSGARSSLTVPGSATQLWVWFPVDALPTAAAAQRYPRVRLSVGSPGIGVEGFRRSHFEALGVHRLLARLGSSAQVAHYPQVRMLALLGDDPAAVSEFIGDVLGEMADDDQLCETIRVWFAAGCNAAQCAQRLYTHRNTVVRRLARADDMLPVRLSSNALQVALALELRAWRR